MRRFTLSNGMKVLTERRPANTVVALLTVKVGSNDETATNNGISHLIEHAVFNGTKNRSALQISGAVETLGGEINAGTTPEKTFYYVKLLPKHLDIGLEVLSELAFTPTFEPKQLETEKRVVAEEISFVYDDIGFYQWVLFQRKLFKGPQRRPVYGSKGKVLGIRRQEILDFHRRFYVPNNMLLTIVGNIPRNALRLIKKHFSSHKPRPVARDFEPEPSQTKCEHTVKLSVQSAYIILGYKVPPRGHSDSILFDIANGVLGRGQSGRLFDTLRNKLGLAYSVGAYHYQGYMYNFFALYANLQARNIPRVKSVFLQELRTLKSINRGALRDAKTFIEGDFFVRNEDNLSLAHTITQWELAGSSYADYPAKVKRLTVKGVRDSIGKYLDDKYCLVAIRPE